jgi:uncharacterized protein (TIGR02217 family)
MSFLETPRFPESISYGAIGGPGYQTNVVIVSSGHEQRNADWDTARGRWEVSQGVKTKTDFDTLAAFFRAVKGRAHGFRFKDWSDYEVSGSDGTLLALGGSTWQMYRTYSAGALTETRKIAKPVSGTVTVSGGGTYSINYATGVITKSAGADPTGWTGEFDVPARFDTDEMRAEVMGPGPLLRWASIPIVEIRT